MTEAIGFSRVEFNSKPGGAAYLVRYFIFYTRSWYSFDPHSNNCVDWGRSSKNTLHGDTKVATRNYVSLVLLPTTLQNSATSIHFYTLRSLYCCLNHEQEPVAITLFPLLLRNVDCPNELYLSYSFTF